jgi:hypothetical protein
VVEHQGADWFAVAGALTEATVERLEAAGLGYMHSVLLRALVRGIAVRVRLTATEADFYIGSEDDTAWLMFRRQDEHAPWAIIAAPTITDQARGDC